MTILCSLTPAALDQLRQARGRVMYTAPTLSPDVTAAPVDAHRKVGAPTAHEGRAP
jgi:hypothetical protein